MRVLLLGCDGQLGFELRGPLSIVANVTALDLPAVDVGDAAALTRAVVDHCPDVIVNASAYTDVDGAERDPSISDRVNHLAVRTMGELCVERGIGLLHVSTDFVFDGRLGKAGDRGYREDDATAPLNVYGRTKRDGELALHALDAPAITLRTAWVYSLRRKSFVSTMLRLAREKKELRVVDDQIGNPTSARDLAAAMAMLVARSARDPFAYFREHRGVFHVAGEGAVSRHALAEAAIAGDPRKSEQVLEQLVAIKSDAMPLPAKRPLFCPLDCTRAGEQLGIALPPWRDALGRALADRG